MNSSARLFTLQYLRKEHIAKDVYSFYFKRNDATFTFLSGQYIRMVLPHDSPDDRGTARFFTIASSPNNLEECVITTKVTSSSFKNTLYNLSPGQHVQFWGPLGNFVLHNNIHNPIVFLAGGMGITPFYSMILDAVELCLPVSIWLFASFSTIENILYYNELQRIIIENHTIHSTYIITHYFNANGRINAETGRIDSNLLKKYLKDLQKYTYYIAGSPTMVDDMLAMLQTLAIPDEQIVIEKYTGY
jgi:ferredoxin-NADP reductase